MGWIPEVGVSATVQRAAPEIDTCPIMRVALSRPIQASTTSAQADFVIRFAFTNFDNRVECLDHIAEIGVAMFFAIKGRVESFNHGTGHLRASRSGSSVVV